MNSTHAPALRQLESGTRAFRDRLAREHRARWVSEHKRARAALDTWDPMQETADEHGEVIPSSTAVVSEEMRDALSIAKWHHGRDNGQKYRFRKLAACGTRMMTAQ